MQITISGDIGTNKVEVGHRLADMMGLHFYDCNEMYKQYMANSAQGEYEYHTELNRRGKEYTDGVYVSNIAWYFMPYAFHINLCIDPFEAAKKMLEVDPYGSSDSVLENIVTFNKERMVKENNYYEELYGVSIDNRLKNAKLIICLGNYNVEDICNCINCILLRNIQEQVFMFDPKIAVPMEPIEKLDAIKLEGYKQTAHYDMNIIDVSIQFAKGIPYIQEGHHRIAAASINRVKFLGTTDFKLCSRPRAWLSNHDYRAWEKKTKSHMHSIIAYSKFAVSDLLKDAEGNK